MNQATDVPQSPQTQSPNEHSVWNTESVQKIDISSGATSITSSGPNCTVIFDSLRVDLQEREPGLSANTAVASVELPIAIPSEKTFTGVAVTVRGFLDKGPGARASLVVEVGNVIKVVEWAFDAPLPEQKDFLVQ